MGVALEPAATEHKRTGLRARPQRLGGEPHQLLTDISSEMVLNLVPSLPEQLLGASTAVIGLIEGLSEATAAAQAVLRLASDRLAGAPNGCRRRLWAPPRCPALLLFRNNLDLRAGRSAGPIAWARGSAPPTRCPVADSIETASAAWPLAFTAPRFRRSGAGVLIALAVVWALQRARWSWTPHFQVVVLASLIPARWRGPWPSGPEMCR